MEPKQLRYLPVKTKAFCYVLFFISFIVVSFDVKANNTNLPDPEIISHFIKQGNNFRKSNKDSAIANYKKAFKLCKPILNTKLSENEKKEYSNLCITALNKIGLVHYFECDYDSATAYYQKALTFAEKFDNRWQEAESLFNIAEVHLEKGGFEEALSIYNKAKQIYSECNDPFSIFHCYNSLGILAKLQGDYLTALDNYNKAFLIADSLDDKISQAYLYNNIGNVYKNRGEYAGAMENYDQAYKIFEEQEETLLMSDCLNNMGDIHKETGSYQRALDYYKRSLEIAESEGDDYRRVGILKNIGEVMCTLSDFSEAAKYFDETISAAEEIGDSVRLADCLKDYGKLYEKQGNYKKAIDYYLEALSLALTFNSRKEKAGINVALANISLQSGNTEDAINYADVAFGVSNEIGTLKEKSNALKILSDAYLAKGDSTTSYDYFKAFTEVKDKLAAIGQQEAIEKIEARHQLVEKEKENRLLKAETESQQNKLRLQNTLVGAMALGLILLGLIIFLLFKRNQDARIMFRQKELINKQKVEELNRELDFKNRELTTKALHQVQNEELLSSISERLESITGSNGNAHKEINYLIRELKADLRKNNWEEFELHFQKVHPRFYKQLNNKFPKLTANEKKLCAFLKLSLKTKDISAITGQSVKSIEVARTRLRKKFNLKQEDNLNAVIDSV